MEDVLDKKKIKKEQNLHQVLQRFWFEVMEDVFDKKN
jgi:hypothetical protein